MAYVKFNSGFKVGSHSAIDARIILSKVDMLSAEEDFAMPDVYFAVCKMMAKCTFLIKITSLIPKLVNLD